MGPFDVIDSLRKGEEWKPEFKAAYSPFLTNKYFSNDKKYLFVSSIADTIVDSEMNYKFWLGLVDKKSRRVPWIKNKKESEELLSISEYYKVSLLKAKEYSKLLSNEDKLLILNIIKEKENESGTVFL